MITAIVCIMLSSCGRSDNLQEDAPQVFNIGGTVTKSDGGAAAGASVMLVKISDGSNAGESPVSAAGEYIITSVIAGNYKITVTLNGYETGSIDEIKVTGADVTVEGIVLQKITVPTYVISGIVTKSNGSAAAGASVQLRKSGDNTLVGQAATADASGAYSVSGIPSGTYTVIATLDGYEAGILPDVTVNNADLTALNITLLTITINANAVSIVFSDNDATVDNLPSDGSVTVAKSGAHVTITSSAPETVEYFISGSTANGSLKIQNNAVVPNMLRITLNSTAIVSASKLPPIQITKNEGVTVV
ncbi:MAG: carboxypeptidase-like regulatory domain-containing protein, partial [Bacteroidales bacterium]|nr:carboxypeptidase-like regulatory domain-containing protein [Bacteroidales bacterium]